MSMILLNIFLAVLWCFMWGWFEVYNLLAGFVMGFIVLALIDRIALQRHYGKRVISLFSFLLYFLRILVIANLQVAREIATPGYQMSPRLLRYDVKDLTPIQITFLANAITLTPGTLSVDVADQEDYLYVHCMYARDRDSIIEELDELRDRILKEVFGQ